MVWSSFDLFYFISVSTPQILALWQMLLTGDTWYTASNVADKSCLTNDCRSNKTSLTVTPFASLSDEHRVYRSVFSWATIFYTVIAQLSNLLWPTLAGETSPDQYLKECTCETMYCTHSACVICNREKTDNWRIHGCFYLKCRLCFYVGFRSIIYCN